MKIMTHIIGKKFCEISTDSLESGVMNREESINMAKQLISAAEDILHVIGEKHASDICGNLLEDLGEIKNNARSESTIERDENNMAHKSYTASEVAELLRDKAADMGGQKALAAAAKVSQTFLSDVINGRRGPSGNLLTFLGLRPEVMFVAMSENDES